MVYQRATEDAYNNWADAVGDDSYNFDNFLPYLQKSLNFTPPDNTMRMQNATPEYDTASIGQNTGPLSVTFPNYAQAFATWVSQGLEQIGLKMIPGFLGGQLLGQAWSLSTVDRVTMTRESSETSFLRESLGNPDYTVYPLTMAKQIVFDDSKKATGVNVDTEGFGYTLSARKEVIVTAGVFGSPQLLLVSGVGPQSALGSLGIPVVADRPGVGQGMQDHVFYGISYRVNAPTLSALTDSTDFAIEQSQMYNDSAAGMYSNTGIDLLGWEKIPEELRSSWGNDTKSTLAAYPSDWPEAEYLSVAALLGKMQDSRHGAPNDGFNYATLAVALCTPRSRGTLEITSKDTSVAPLINPNFLTNQADVDVMIAGFKRAREFFATDAMQSFVLGDEYFPGSAVSTDAQIENAIRTDFETVWHAACTCAMGKADDPNAVVDSQAKVIGVQGLRVVDAAAFPFLPPGHPQATVCEYSNVEQVMDYS